MKKKIWFSLAAVLLLLAILFVPIPQTSADDGGSREYVAITYKIVDWNRITEDGIYEATRVYWGADRKIPMEELWGYEIDKVEQKFLAIVTDHYNSTFETALVEPLEGEWERSSSDLISVSWELLKQAGAEIGDIVEVTYTGGIMEIYPAAINETKVALANDLRNMEYQGEWIDTSSMKPWADGLMEDLVIDKIYADCVFAYPLVPMPYTLKLNGDFGADWCVGDKILVEYGTIYYDQNTQRAEAEVLSVAPSDMILDPDACYKPVIYLYPEEVTEVAVELRLNGELTCTYPAYRDGWQVTAYPDGTLLDGAGQSYNYLYWEGEVCTDFDMSQGFCVAGGDTAAFLEDALEKLGLTRREANEFIVYWLPLMEQNPYNVIAFQTDAYTDAARLQVNPTPDTTIRVFMTWQGVEEAVEIAPQELTAPARTGFTLVEWGGTEIR